MSRIPTLSQQRQEVTGVSGLLFSAAEIHPDTPYLRDRFGVELSYGEVADRVRSRDGWWPMG